LGEVNRSSDDRRIKSQRRGQKDTDIVPARTQSRYTPLRPVWLGRCQSNNSKLYTGGNNVRIWNTRYDRNHLGDCVACEEGVRARRKREEKSTKWEKSSENSLDESDWILPKPSVTASPIAKSSRAARHRSGKSAEANRREDLGCVIA